MVKIQLHSLLGLVVISLAVVSAIAIVLASDFSASSNVSSAISRDNTTINITVSNTNTTRNITQVNITLPTGFSFVTGSNNTNTTALFTSNSTVLSWTNLTQFGIVNASTGRWFSFNVIVPERQGNFNFTITEQDANMTSVFFNSTNITFAVVPSAPASNNLFGATPSPIRLNWTNSYTSNVSITVNASVIGNLFVNLRPDLTLSKLSPNYSQSAEAKCNPYTLTVINTSAIRANTSSMNITLNPASTLAQNVTFFFDPADTNCLPGRYSTQTFMLQNATDITINASMVVIADIPISTNNTLSNITGIGNFSGTMPGNGTAFQSFYFFINNASSILNATGARINVTWTTASRDIDVFLLDQNGRLRAKSINKTGNELLSFNFFPSSGETWEIRVFGNDTASTSYNGWIIFTTLNATEQSNANNRVSNIDFGTVNVSTLQQKNITLINNGNITINNISQTIDLFYVKRFSGNGEKNFTFLVPDSSMVNRLRVGVNWTGSGNYSFNVTSANSTILMSSANRSRLANQSGVEQEEFDEKFNIPANPEIWTIWVKNNSLPTDYNVTVSMRQSSSNWLTSNFTSTTLNRTGVGTFAYNFTLNFTIPNQTLDGVYEGKASYLDINGAGIEIPIRMNVTSPTLLINNSYVAPVVYHADNAGYGRNMTLSLIFTNNGTWPLTLSYTNSTSKLSCASGCSTADQANLTFDSVSSLAKDASKQINVSITFNSSQSGVYDGWIFVMANSTLTSDSSRPNATFNITVRLNLTREVVVSVIKAVDTLTELTHIWNVTGTTSKSNISFAFDLYYLNGTKITSSNSNLSAASVVSLFMQEGNVSDSTGRIPVSGNLVVFNRSTQAGSDIYCTSSCAAGWTTDNHYFLNATLRAGIPGGRYMLFFSVSPNGNGTFNGTGNLTDVVVVNNTGIQMAALNSTTISLTTTNNFYINVTNFGPQNETTYVNLSSSCSGYSPGSLTLISAMSKGCNAVSGVSGDSNNATLSINTFGGSCVIRWTLTNKSTNADACTSRVVGSPADNWFNPNGINISVTVGSGSSSSSSSSSSSTSSSSTTSSSNATTAATSNPKYLDITKSDSVIEIGQGKSGTSNVTVKNVNDTVTQTASLSIVGLNSSISSLVTPDSASIIPGGSSDFKTTFNVPNSTDVASYSGTFKATSSSGSASKEFSIHVLPGAAAKVQINSTFVEIKDQFLAFWKELNDTKALGANVSATELVLAQLKVKIDAAEAALAQGTDSGYFAASQLFDEVRNLLNTAKAQLKIDQQKSGPLAFLSGSLLLYIGIGVGVAVVGFLVYLFLPSKGAGGIKLRKPGKEQVAAKLSSAAGTVKDTTGEQWKNLQEKFKLKKEYKYKYEE